MRILLMMIIGMMIGGSLAYGESSMNFLTKGYADTLYCRIDGSCLNMSAINITINASTISNATLWSMFANASNLMNNRTIANAIDNNSVIRNASNVNFNKMTVNNNATFSERLAIGTASFSYPFYVYLIDSKNSASNYLANIMYYVNQTNETSVAYYYALANYVSSMAVNTYNISLMIGNENKVAHTGGGRLSDARGMQNTVMLQGNGSIITAYGAIQTVQIYGTAATGNITSAIGLYINNKNQGKGTKITTSTGLQVADVTKDAGNEVTNNYGIQISSMTAGTNNFAIKTNLGRVDFGDNVTTTGSLAIGTTTPKAKLHVIGNDTLINVTNTTSSLFAIIGGSGDTIFNDAGSDGDFTVRSEGVPQALYVRGTDGKVFTKSTGGIQIGSDTDNFLINHDGSTAQLVATGANQLDFNQIGNGVIRFKTNNTERMRIIGGGAVGIGTSTPNATLSLNSTGNIFNISNVTDTLFFVTDQNGGIVNIGKSPVCTPHNGYCNTTITSNISGGGYACFDANGNIYFSTAICG